MEKSNINDRTREYCKNNPLKSEKKEQQKQETLEEAKIKHTKFCIENKIENPSFSFDKGAKWQSEQENTANDILNYILTNDDGVGIALGYNSREMIEQHFKNIGYER